MKTKEKISPDQLLRNYGYRIVARPVGGEPTWVNSAGVVLTQTAAMKHIKDWQKRNAVI